MSNPLSIIPKKVRLALYIVYVVGIVVLKYTEAKGWTGQSEEDLWLNLGIAVGALAASNVPPKPVEYVGEHRAPLVVELGAEDATERDANRPEGGPDVQPQGYVSGV